VSLRTTEESRSSEGVRYSAQWRPTIGTRPSGASRPGAKLRFRAHYVTHSAAHSIIANFHHAAPIQLARAHMCIAPLIRCTIEIMQIALAAHATTFRRSRRDRDLETACLSQTPLRVHISRSYEALGGGTSALRNLRKRSV
jgi:hypothetical protein